jgi:lysozyme
MASKKPTVRRPRKRKIAFFSSKISRSLYVALFVFILCGIGYHYRNALTYYFSFRSDKTWDERKLHAIRNVQVLSRHADNVVGIDVSEYQGEVNWRYTDSVEGACKIGFAFIRATYGDDCLDAQFRHNWRGAREAGMIRGAYHYYRPDENSLKQAQNFITNVPLLRGDLPPVLDIERIPEGQSVDSLKIGLRRWLAAVERHYHVRPIVYCGEKYYYDFLQDEFKAYTVWVANYNFMQETIDPGWQFWQFTQNGSVKGIPGDTDIDIFNGTQNDLNRIRLK